MKIKLLNVDLEKGIALARYRNGNHSMEILSLDLMGGIQLKEKYKINKEIFTIPNYQENIGRLVNIEDPKEEKNLW